MKRIPVKAKSHTLKSNYSIKDVDPNKNTFTDDLMKIMKEELTRRIDEQLIGEMTNNPRFPKRSRKEIQDDWDRRNAQRNIDWLKNV